MAEAVLRRWRWDFKTPIHYLVEFENVELILIGSMATISEELRAYAREIVKVDELAGQLSRAKPTKVG